MTSSLLAIENLSVRFEVPDLSGQVARTVHALAGVSLRLAPHEAVGIVGESGSGKSTLARAVVGLERPSAGRILIDGREVPPQRGAAARLGVQMIFQDPTSTLNPFQTIWRNLADVLLLARPELTADGRRDAAARLLAEVGLGADALDRYPQSFSGGQRQRIAIARALAARPRLLICDEPTSALDVSVQAQVLAIFARLKAEGQALLFISHNLAVVRQISDRIVVMRQGRIVEEGSAEQILSNPREDYTRLLIAAAPRLTDRGSLLAAGASAREARMSDRSASVAGGWW
ncbi:ABC transporter ATP-binding protein [Chelativorans sp. J32]|uniref:ABC transporter ATP-binding protein n=1 Tax=Chelativorans sp. J32 TaxID=935840 RepID=UPI00047F820B|nr:ATP-binding cassette domain-containing protein [Chelativorans sp. J32]